MKKSSVFQNSVGCRKFPVNTYIVYVEGKASFQN